MFECIVQPYFLLSVPTTPMTNACFVHIFSGLKCCLPTHLLLSRRLVSTMKTRYTCDDIFHEFLRVCMCFCCFRRGWTGNQSQDTSYAEHLYTHTHTHLHLAREMQEVWSMDMWVEEGRGARLRIACVDIHVCMYRYVQTHIHMHACMKQIYAYKLMSMSVGLWVCLYVYVCVSPYEHTSRWH